MDPTLTGLITALWLTAAILAGGYARTRNRSAWTGFVLTVFLGPLAAFLLVTWPVRQSKSPHMESATSAASVLDEAG